MDPRYKIENTAEIITPAYIVYAELVEDNIRRMVAMAGDPARIRPHCKTHKMARVAELELAQGITKHKAATFAEAEMLARAGVKDILLAYNIVGANIARCVQFVKNFPDVAFAVTADHEQPIAALGQAMTAAGARVGVLLDLDVGQHRTGVPVGDRARELYRKIASTPGLVPQGLHSYDGHQHQKDPQERAAAINAEFRKVVEFRDQLSAQGLPVPRIVAGGTGGFPIYAAKEDPTIEASPGTCVLHDAGYGSMFPDMQFIPAALILTRVISRPSEDRVTLDLGYKACASDPPAGKRVVFPDLPDAEIVLQNEEHLVLKTAEASRFVPGDELLAIPWHVCPTSALHKSAYVVRGGRIVDRWEITARDRWLTV